MAEENCQRYEKIKSSTVTVLHYNNISVMKD
jgi:hypothetical protein